MTERESIFAGDDPFQNAQRWLSEAEASEPADANAMALSTVDGEGMPNTRIVLLKSIEDDGFVFFTNYNSSKGREIQGNGRASFVLYWKSLGRQIRVRGNVSKIEEGMSDKYYETRPYGSRIGAWASRQSEPLVSRDALVKAVDAAEREHGENPRRPSHWGGYKIVPVEMEFWANGEFRLHDRFRWVRPHAEAEWHIQRLNP